MPKVNPPELSVKVERLPNITLEQYRFLYNSVGEDYHWVDRNRMADDELRRILSDSGVEIYVLQVGGRTAGLAELDCRDPRDIELAYFGLFPGFIGKGLGKYFLYWTLNKAWSRGPRRVWVHTCDLDHPAALATYLKAGFSVYDRRIIQQVI